MNSPSRERTRPKDSSFCHPGANEAFDLDLLLRSLAHPTRREILCLLDSEPEWSMAEIAANLGSVETVPAAGANEDVEVALHHCHLPMLEDANLVVVDEESGRVKRGRDFHPVREMVDAAVAAMS